jgi:two-component system response regulator MtrA
LAGEIRSTVESTSRLTETRTRRSLQFGHFSIDPQRERIRLGAAIVHLSRTEFDLLYKLASNAGSVYNTETLLRTVWGPDYVPQGKPVDVAIHRLRRKLDTFPGGTRLIRTVRGRGYTFVTSEASALLVESPSP